MSLATLDLFTFKVTRITPPSSGRLRDAGPLQKAADRSIHPGGGIEIRTGEAPSAIGSLAHAQYLKQAPIVPAAVDLGRRPRRDSCDAAGQVERRRAHKGSPPLYATA